MAFNINDVLSNFQFQGARPTLFQVFITNPTDSSADAKIQFTCTATSIPEYQTGNIPIPYFGRVINTAGDRTYDPWTVTINNDEDFAIRNAMESWQDSINTKQGNLRTNTNYKSTAQINQFDKTGNLIRQYTMHGIYPGNISPIKLDWEGTNQFERFDVRFMYDWWEVTGGSTGTAGGT